MEGVQGVIHGLGVSVSTPPWGVQLAFLCLLFAVWPGVDGSRLS